MVNIHTGDANEDGRSDILIEFDEQLILLTQGALAGYENFDYYGYRDAGTPIWADRDGDGISEALLERRWAIDSTCNPMQWRDGRC